MPHINRPITEAHVFWRLQQTYGQRSAQPNYAAPAMAPPSPPSLTILETSQISPSAAAAGPTRSLPLTFFDIFWIYSPPVERLFFYEFSAAVPAPSFLPALKSSLALALQSYFPLAGRLRLSPDAADRYEIFCSGGDSVALTFAEAVDGGELDFEELSGGRQRDAAKLRMLVPELEPQALLAIQVTAFPRRGAAVGVAVHHAACDGSTSTRFLNAWAAACRRILNPDAVLSPPPPLPLVDRSVISDPRGLYSIFYHDRLSPDHFELIADPAAAAAAAATDGVLFASFKLTRTHIQAIKKWIAARSPRQMNCSTTVAVYAFVWAGHARARPSSGAGGGGLRRRLHFLFPADFRRRVEPAIPAEYFGNCIGPCFAEADAEELLGGEGLAAAAAAIARGIEELSSGLEGAENWMTRVNAVVVEQPLTAAGSPRFGVYEVDFGWGRPRRVEIVSVANTGAVALAESPDEDEGGVQIGLGLRRPELELFQNYFVQALKDLTE